MITACIFFLLSSIAGWTYALYVSARERRLMREHMDALDQWQRTALMVVSLTADNTKLLSMLRDQDDSEQWKNK